MSFLYIGIVICTVMLVLSLVIFKWDKIKSFFEKHFHKNSSGKNGKKNKDKNGKLRGAEAQFRPILKPPEKDGDTMALENAKEKSDPQVDKLKDFSKLSGSNKNSFEAEQERLRQKKMLDEEFEDVKKFLSMNNPNKSGSSNSFFDSAKNSKNNFDSRRQVAGQDERGDLFGDISDDKEEFLTNKGKMGRENTMNNFVPTKMYEGDFGAKNVRSNLTGDNDIDLSRLPPRLKQFVLTTVLARKNFDD